MLHKKRKLRSKVLSVVLAMLLAFGYGSSSIGMMLSGGSVGSAHGAEIKPPIEVDVVNKATGGATTFKSGTQIPFAITYQSTLSNFDIVLAVPKPAPGDVSGTCTISTSGSGVSQENKAENGITIKDKNGDTIALDHAVVVHMSNVQSGILNGYITMPNGYVKNGETFKLVAYGVDSVNGTSNPSYTKSSEITYTATADPVVKVEKTLTTAGQPFTSNESRTYVQALHPNDSEEDTYTLAYDIKVIPNTSDTLGRVFYSDITVHDTISGFLSAGVPKSIRVTEDGNSVALNSQYNPADVSGTETNFSFKVPGDSYKTSPLKTRTFRVEVDFAKADYTNRVWVDPAFDPVLNGPKAIQNAAKVSYTPVTDEAELTTPISTVDAAIGWQQEKPALSKLTINQKFSVSGQSRDYNQTWAGIYPTVAGETIKYVLTPEDGGSAITKELTPGQSVEFKDLTPGTYTLTTTGKISNGAEVSLGNADAKKIVVEEPDSSGVSHIKYEGEGTSNSINLVINAMQTLKDRAIVTFSAEKQTPYAYPATFTGFKGAKLKLVDNNGTVYASGETGDAGSGYKVTFENIPTSLTGGLNYLIEDNGSIFENGIDEVIHQDEVGAIEPSTTEIKNFNVKYHLNDGGIQTFVTFKNPDGSFASVSNFEATFRLFKTDGTTPAFTDGSGAVDTSKDFTITSSSVNNTIQKSYPAGEYVLKQMGLTVNGVNATNEYAIANAANIKIKIVAGEFNAMPEERVAGNNAPLVVNKDSGDNITSVGILNTVNSGQLAIKSLDINSGYVAREFTVVPNDPNGTPAFSVKLNTSGQIDDSCIYDDGSGTKYIKDSSGHPTTVIVDDDGNLTVRAGNYTIAPKEAGDGSLVLASMGESLQSESAMQVIGVAAGDIASANATVAGTLDNPIISGNSSHNTATFVFAYSATLKYDKVVRGDTDAPLAGAKFALYKLDSNNNYVNTSKTALSDATGSVTFTGITAGKYAIVEVGTPAGKYYKLPANSTADKFISTYSYTNGVYSNIVLADSVASSDVNNTPIQSVSASDYGASQVGLVTYSGSIKAVNVPLHTIKVGAINNGNHLPGFKFGVYGSASATGTPLATVTASATDTVFTAIDSPNPYFFAPGTYYIRQISTSTAGNYIPNTSVAKIVIDSEGKVTTSKESEDFLNLSIVTSKSSGQDMGIQTSNETTIKFNEAIYPNVNVYVQGETEEFQDNGIDREVATIGKNPLKYTNSKYVVYYEDEEGNKHYISAEANTGNSYTDSQSSAKVYIPDTSGNFTIKYLDPTKEYKVECILNPAMPSDNPAGLKYNPLDDISFDFNNDDGVYKADATGMKDDGDNRFIITHKIKTYHINLSKLPIKPQDDGNGGYQKDGNGDILFTEDLRAGEAAWDDTIAFGAQFDIYKLSDDGLTVVDGDGDPSNGISPVSRISAGTGSTEDMNSGWSRSLPAGKYWIAETKEPINYPPLGSWYKDESGAAQIIDDDNQDTSVYIRDNEGKNDINLGAAEAWKGSNSDTANLPSGVPDAAKYGTLIEVGGSNMADIDGVHDITFGNSNRDPLENTRPAAPKQAAYITLNGEATGYTMQINGQYKKTGTINNAKYRVYEGYLGVDGKYHKLIPKEDSNGERHPIDTVSTRTVTVNGEEKQGQFILPYFEARAAYRTNGTTDWTETKKQPAPVGGWGTVEFADTNSLYTFTVLFEQYGSLPDNYSPIDEDNPPIFAFTVTEDTYSLFRNFTANTKDVGTIQGVWGVDNADGTYKVVPFELPNYRGSGKLTLDKKTTTNVATQGDITFELWKINPESIKSDGKPDLPSNPTASDLTSKATYVKDIKTTNGTLENTPLPPGYYYLVEQDGNEKYNPHGNFSVTVDEPPVESGDQFVPGASLDVSATTFAKDGALGPIIVFADGKRDDGSDQSSTKVTIKDYMRPNLAIEQQWQVNSTVNASDTAANKAYQVTYEITKTDSNGYTYGTNNKKDLVVMGGSTAKSTNTYTYLPDGEYTLAIKTFPSISGATAEEKAVAKYSGPNSNLVNGKTVKLVVTDGKVTSIKDASDASVGTSIANSLWTDTAKSKVGVRMPALGAIAVKKAYLDPSGADVKGTNASTWKGPASAEFEYVKVDATGNEIGTTDDKTKGSLVWNGNQDASFVNGSMEPVPQGVYKVTEKVTITDDNFTEDTNPVYVEVKDSGISWIKNSSRLTENSVTKPIEPNQSTATASDYFYNTSKEGTAYINLLTGTKSSAVKVAASDPGYTYEVYKKDAEGKPDGAAVATFGSGLSWDSTEKAYKVTLPAGEYLVDQVEVALATPKYGARDGYFPLTITQATKAVASGSYTYKDADSNGADDQSGVNRIGILQAAPVTLSVTGETTPTDAFGNLGSTMKLPEFPVEFYERNSNTTGGKLVSDSDYAYSNAISDFTKKSATTTSISTAPGSYAHATYSIYHMGEYRAIENLNGYTRVYVLPNAKYAVNSENTTLGTAPSFKATYDIDTNAYVIEVVSANDDFSASGKTQVGISSPANTLFIGNEYATYQYAVEKVDYDDTTKKLSGARFGLFENIDDPDAAAIETATTDENGQAVFETLFNKNNPEKRYIRELAAPSGYTIDSWYDDITKEVNEDNTSTTPLENVAKFKNGKANSLGLAITKTSSVDQSKLKPLNEEGFNTTYTLTATRSASNIMPLYDYTVSESLLQFKNGSSAITNVTDHMPTYQVKDVEVYGASVAKSTVKTETGSDINSVWAGLGVDGNRVWKKLSTNLETATSWNPSEFSGNKIPQNYDVVYSDIDPTSVSGYNIAVGSDFKAGKITADVTVDKFIGTKEQKEVNAITNTASVSTKLQKTSTAIVENSSVTINLPIKSRPSMEVSITRTDGLNAISPSTDDNTTLLKYKLTLKNTGAVGSEPIVDPIIVDYLDPGKMTLSKVDAITTADGTRLTDSGDIEDAGIVSSSKSGNMPYWLFKGTKLNPGESVSVEVEVRLSSIIPENSITNEVYGTSDIDNSSVKPSVDYPIGASFTVIEENDSVYSGSSINGSKYTKVTSFGSPAFAAALFATASKEDTTISSGAFTMQKSVSVTHNNITTPWNNSNIPEEVQLGMGDTINYELAAALDDNENKNLVLYDVLPAQNDTYSNGDPRNTEWTSEATSLLSMDAGSIKVTYNTTETLTNGSDYKVTYYKTAKWRENDTSQETTNPAEAKSFKISILKDLEPNSIVTASYSMSMNDTSLNDADLKDLLIAKENDGKIMTNSMAADYSTKITDTVTKEFTPDSKKGVSVKLIWPKSTIVGYVWNDKNRDGIKDPDEEVFDNGGKVKLIAEKTSDNAVNTLAYEPMREVDVDSDGRYVISKVTKEDNTKYKLVFTNPNYETYNFSPTGADNAVTTLTSAANATNIYYNESGMTDEIDITDTSIDKYNCGLYAIPSYKVTYKPENGDASWEATVKAGELVPPARKVAYDKYDFNGWFDEQNNLWKFDTDTMPERDLVLTAKWTKQPEIPISGGGETGKPEGNLTIGGGDVIVSKNNPEDVRYMSGGKSDGKSPENKGGEYVETGDTSNALPLGILASISLMIAVVLVSRRKSK